MEEFTEYDFTIYTSNIPGAGTDSGMTLVLEGELGSTPEIELENTEGVDYQAGSVNGFAVEAPDVGELRYLHIKSDNHGEDPSWHLDRFEVIEGRKGRKYVFPFGSWINENYGLEHTIAAIEVGQGGF